MLCPNRETLPVLRRWVTMAGLSVRTESIHIDLRSFILEVHEDISRVVIVSRPVVKP